MVMLPVPAKQLTDTKGDETGDLPVPERQYPASPEGIASFDAWWNDMLPAERAFLEAMRVRPFI